LFYITSYLEFFDFNPKKLFVLFRENPACIDKGTRGAHGDRPDSVYLFRQEFIMSKKHKKSYKVGRDAGTGRFIPVKEAERRKKKSAVVETIKRK